MHSTTERGATERGAEGASDRLPGGGGDVGADTGGSGPRAPGAGVLGSRAAEISARASVEPLRNPGTLERLWGSGGQEPSRESLPPEPERGSYRLLHGLDDVGEPGGLSSAHIWPEPVREWREREEKRETETREGLEFAKGGSVGRVVFSREKRVQVGGGLRGQIKEFSRGSRRRMMDFVNSFDQEQVTPERVWFVTLTLPGENPSQEPQDWQRWLAAIRKRVQRKWGRFPIVWKLEFQARGAAHWHLLAVIPLELVPQLREFRSWLATAWFQVVGSGQETHRRAGTQVDPVRSWGGIVSYASKYLGKVVPQVVNPDTGEVITPGRFWGVWNRDLLPIEWVSVALAREALFQVRRVIRRYTGRPSQGRLWTCHAYAPSKMWERLAVWARGSPAEPKVNRSLVPA